VTSLATKTLGLDKQLSKQFIDLSVKGKVFIEYRGRNSYKTHATGDDLRVEVVDKEFAADIHYFHDNNRAVLLNGATCDTFLFGPNSRAVMCTTALAYHFRVAIQEFASKKVSPRQLRHVAITSLLSDPDVTYTQLECIAKVTKPYVPTLTL
jgi:site-specific recombinase XerD